MSMPDALLKRKMKKREENRKRAAAKIEEGKSNLPFVFFK